MLIAMLLAAAPVPAVLEPANDRVEQAVTTAFPSHDTDGNGKLSRAEFAAWMLSLKAQANPRKRSDGPAARKWVAGAFALADVNGNATVTPDELTGFLRRDRS